MAITITAERPDAPDAISLIEELEAQLAPFYPAASRHGLSVKQLLEQHVAFFVLRTDGMPVGCGGIKLTDDGYGELKRMYVRPQFRGRGFATTILDQLADYARSHGILCLRLETGVHQHEAIGLYERTGFHRIPPFGLYTNDPLSVFFEKRIPSCTL